MNPPKKFEARNASAGVLFRIFLPLCLGISALAQDGIPSPSLPPPAASPTLLFIASPSPSPTASPTPSLLKKIGVKIQFLPPPIEGTISLGIYDSAGKLVRILHREAAGDEFVAALDGFITHWDGTDDAGQLLPPGHYSASGYMVGAVNVSPVHASLSLSGSLNAIPAASQAPGATPPAAPVFDTLESALPSLKFPNGKPFVPEDKIQVGLIGNPLERDRAGRAELSTGFDAKGSWLQLADGLPLKQISVTPNLKWVALGRSGIGEPLVFFQSDGATIEEFLITKVSNMMAFDCGGFDFTPGTQDH